MNSKLETRHSGLPLAWRLAVTVFVINVLYATTYLGNPMSKSILDLTVSLVDRRALDIDPYAGNSTDVATRDGHFYSGMPPGVSWICVPYYLVAKTWLWRVATPEREEAVDKRFLDARGAAWKPSEKHLTIVLLNLFICAFGCAVLAGAMAALFHYALTVLYPDLAERRRLATTWLLCFGTIWFIYSPGIYHRVFSTVLCFSAFLLVLRPEDRRPALSRRGLWFGLALGLAIASTYEMVLPAAVLGIYAAARWGRRWSWKGTVLGAALFLVLLAAYHTACFGAPWITPYAMRMKGSVVPPLFTATERPVVSELERLVAFLVGSRYGILFYSPVLLLAFPALSRLRRGEAHRAVAAVAFGVFAVLFVFHYATGYDGLPGEYGFRLMLPAIPFLMLLVPLSYGWSYRVLVPVLSVLSAAVIGKGVLYGVHAGRPMGPVRLGFWLEHLEFWRDYPDYIRRYGFSNYTLAELKDHIAPDLSPYLLSAIHLGVLGAVIVVLWRFVWRPRFRSE